MPSKDPVTVLSGTKPHTCMPKQDMVHLGSTVGIPTVRDPRDGTKLWTSLQWSNDASPCVFNTRVLEYQIVPGR
jgi:hypothetical protein